jgi:hypothetical protein
LSPRDVPLQPFSMICVDHIGPLTISRNGNAYALVVVDYTTRFQDAVPVQSTSADCTIEALIQIFGDHGLPSIMVRDKARYFESDKCKRFFRDNGIVCVTAHSYFPQANGLVERSIQTLSSVLRKSVNEKGDDWDEKLQFALLSINNSRQDSLRKSPFFLLHGYYPRMPGTGAIVQFNDDLDNEDRLSQVQRSRLKAINNLHEANAYNKALYDKGRRQVSFGIGEKVLFDYHHIHLGERRKFLPTFEGEFLVIKKIGDNYELQKVYSPGRTVYKTAHVSQLRSAAESAVGMFKGLQLDWPVVSEKNDDADVLQTSVKPKQTNESTKASVSVKQKTDDTIVVDTTIPTISNVTTPSNVSTKLLLARARRMPLRFKNFDLN